MFEQMQSNVTHHKYLAFVDEAGDQGFSSKSSVWFVVAAMIVPEGSLSSVDELWREVRQKLNAARSTKISDDKPIHFCKLKHEERRYVAKAIGDTNYLRLVVVAIHKPSLRKQLQRSGDRLFLYAVRLLAERVSWCCRDWAGLVADASVCLIFSQKGKMKAETIKEYLERLYSDPQKYKYRGVRNIDAQKTLIARPLEYSGLQIADVVASSYLYAIRENVFGMVEPSYAEFIHSLAYAPAGRVFRNGIKLFPEQAEDLARQRGLLQSVFPDFGL